MTGSPAPGPARIESTSGLPSELAEKLEAYVSGHPERRSVVERLVSKRDRAASSKERETIEQLLWSLVRRSRRPWLIGAAILVVGGGILAAALLRETKHRSAVASGTPTLAQVLRMDDGSCLVTDRSSDCVKLSLELYPARKAPYRAELSENIKYRFLSRVQPGAWLTVAVNPERPSEVFFDEASMAVPPPTGIEAGR